ncbi:MAG: hypothetical protein M1818_004653 [Claussenomyces sp. TS43310]|nr:MAG: hypothetical protein M1818_004653 [Claussenomyces sp. TS43310]
MEDTPAVASVVDGPVNMEVVQNSPASAENGKRVVERGHSRYIESTVQLQSSKSVMNDLSDEDTPDTSPKLQTHAENLLFGRPVLRILSSQHPGPVQIFRLWQAFLDNVNPLVKLFHAPTVHQSILEATTDLSKISRDTEALMFSIYLSSVTSLTDDECRNIMGESRSVLLSTFSNAAQQALINAKVLRSTNLTVVQAFTLFLLSMRQHYDPQTLWLFTGLAVRAGQRIGLHRESASQGLSVFDSEIRRRLWRQIIILDTRTAQLSGTASDVDSYLSSDSKWPLNINDSDLYPTMKEPPAEHKGVTEMLFCSIRYEIGKFMYRTKIIKTFAGNDTSMTVLASMSDKDKAIGGLEKILEQNYVSFCDPSIPFHLLATCLARGAVSRVKFMVHHPRQFPDNGESLPQYEKDKMFSTCLEIIELDHFMYTTTCLRKYLWHVNVFFPLDAFILILTDLSRRLDGELVDRAWELVGQEYECHPELVANLKNPLYFAIGNLAIRAWDKKVAGCQGSRQVATPRFISSLRSQRESKLVQTQPKHVGTDNTTAYDHVGDASQILPTLQSYTNEWSDSFVADPSLTSDYVPMDVNLMDWEYWQTFLESQEPSMLDVSGQQLFPL